ncbi:MAG: NAD(P)-dependent glycerol-3-phosphate dehydrogenase, partial [Bdellovibrio sp.]|nr:NAD(P)-dependent glycerol-3-phosphate dehydrogenase [Bdellovibrio sp.]
DMKLNEKIVAYSDMERVFEGGLQGVIWALPSSVCRQQARIAAKYFKGDEIILHATKGIEPGSLKRISQVLTEEIPSRRIGVISGPNLAQEIARGEPAATVVASVFSEVCESGQVLLMSEKFRAYTATDVVGVEWAGALKNIFAIAAGAIDVLNLGWNSRAMLITRSLAEMARFGTAMGAKESTFLGLAGAGDLLATCSSSLSRNYRVGQRLAKGERLSAILLDLGSTAEGVATTKSIYEFALQRQISMPITEGVNQLLEGREVREVLSSLMRRPGSIE